GTPRAEREAYDGRSKSPHAPREAYGDRHGITSAFAWNSISPSSFRSVMTRRVFVTSPGFVPRSFTVSTWTALLSVELSLTLTSLSVPRTLVILKGLTPRTTSLRSASAPTLGWPSDTTGVLTLSADSISTVSGTRTRGMPRLFVLSQT